MASVIHGGEIFAAARRRETALSGILDFSANINPLGLSPKARERVKRELDLACHYPDRQQAELRELLAAREKVDPDCILFGNGATQLIHLIARSLKPRKGLVAEPSFAEYRAALLCSGCTATEFRLRRERHFRLDVDEFLEVLGHERPQLVILGNPNNPTGSCILHNDLLQLVRVCASRQNYLVIDESFIDFTNQSSLVTLAARQRLLIVLRSFTKFFAIPGLRIGYLVGHRSVVRHLEAQLEPWSVNALALVAAAESLKDEPYRKRTLGLIAREKQYVRNALAKIGWLEACPSEANFLLVRVKVRDFRGHDLRRRLEQENILIRDASGFRGLGPQYVRIAIRSRQENRRLLDALHAIRAGTFEEPGRR